MVFLSINLVLCECEPLADVLRDLAAFAELEFGVLPPWTPSYFLKTGYYGMDIEDLLPRWSWYSAASAFSMASISCNAS